MKKILVKAAMPIAPFNPNEVNDLSSLRLMPANRLSTYSMPIPLSDANLGFERAVLETGGEALPGFDETDKFGRRLAGTWAALPAYRYFAEPDVSEANPNRPMQLVGILNQDPEWSAGRNQGRLESEGFYYGGVDPSLYRNMNLPPSMGREDLMIGARGAMLERGEDLGNQGFRRRIPEQAIRRQIENSKHHKAIQDALLALDLPAVGNLGMWKRPSIRDTTDFRQRTWDAPPYALPPRPIYTGEPMDLSWRLLKNEEEWREEAKFLPTYDLEGQGMSVAESMTSHPNWKLFQEAGHPEDRIDEFFGTNLADRFRKTRVFDEEWAFREQDEEDQLKEMGLYEEPITDKTQDKLDFAPDVFMEHERHNIRNLPGGGQKHEKVPAFGNVNIRTPAPVDEYNYGVVAGPKMQKYPLFDMEEYEFSPWQTRSKYGNLRNTRQRGFSPQDQMKYTGEPMDIAMRLLKQGLELQPPMTQGVEEEIPVQEEIPIVDAEMEDYESPCECAERIRNDILVLLRDAMNDDERGEQGKKYFREQYQKWQGHACEEILQWAETTNGFNPSHYCNNNYMSEADQMKYTGEPMDLAWRLLKEDDIRENISDYAQIKNWGTVDEIVDHIFDMGYPKTPFLSMNNNQLRLLNQMIFNHGTDGKPNPPSYWREPFQEADYDLESEILMGDGMEHIPDEVYDELIRYHQHYNDAVNELPGGGDPTTQKERELHYELMSQDPIPETHPHNIATQRMRNEYSHWGEDDVDFGDRYGLVHSERQFTPDFDDASWQDSLERAEPIDLSWRMLKAQQTIDAYSRENVEEGFEPDVQNVIIASKPGAENINAEEQSRLHDEMLRRISELEGTENMRIMSARGRSEEWGDENAFMLTNVPDDVMPKIHSLAEEFGQESILHSPKGMAGTRFVDSKGEVTGGLEEGEFTRRKPANYTEFPTGQKYSYGDYVAASEPMSIGDVLVKALDLDFQPTVQADMDSNSGDCCEKVRQWLLRGLKPESEGYNQIMNASCEEIKSGQVGNTKFLYDKVAEVMGCSEGFDSDFQNINTGEPMDLSWRLLKLDYPDAERDAVLGDSVVPFPEQADEGLGLPEEGWEDEVVNRTHNPESKKTIMCHNFLHDRSPTPEEIQMVEDHISDKEGEWYSHYAGRGIDLQQRPDGNFVYEGNPDAPYEYQRGMQNAGHPTPLLRNKHRRVSMGLKRNSRVCGTMVPITNSWENPCPNPECGAWYNGNGAKLADPEDKLTGEPMDLGDVLVKERVSPEAKRHKLEYDTAYEASPERRKYRADLNRERRRRGIYGDHSQLDVSHTEGGRLTIEPAHENRARHFKNRGTLRHVGVKKPRNE